MPILPPPNEHAKDLMMPVRLLDLIAPAKLTSTYDQDETLHTAPYMRCIKKAKGLGPLQIDLSWM